MISPVLRLTRVGLIGGMGWESSAVYYRILNEEVRRRFGGSRSAAVHLDSLDFAELAPLVAARDWATLTSTMVEAAVRLERAGVELLALCSNTAHIAADALTAATSCGFIHIADPVARLVRDAGAGTVGLLATRPTLDQDVLASRWRDSFGLVALEPRSAERDQLDDLIYGRLLTSGAGPHDGERVMAIAEALIARGADAIVLACTDLAPVMDTRALDVPVFDTADAHARGIAAVIRLADG